MNKQEQDRRRELKRRRRELDRQGGRAGVYGFIRYREEISRIDQELRAKPVQACAWPEVPPEVPRPPVQETRRTFAHPIAPRRPRPMRAGWVRLSPYGAVTERGHFRYEPNGAEVSHCGHPTANYPYLVVASDGRFCLAPNGRAFRLLKDAMAAAEAL